METIKKHLEKLVKRQKQTLNHELPNKTNDKTTPPIIPRRRSRKNKQ